MRRVKKDRTALGVSPSDPRHPQGSSPGDVDTSRGDEGRFVLDVPSDELLDVVMGDAVVTITDPEDGPLDPDDLPDEAYDADDFRDNHFTRSA